MKNMKWRLLLHLISTLTKIIILSATDGVA